MNAAPPTRFERELAGSTRHPLAPLVMSLYARKRLRAQAWRLARKLEINRFRSETMRRILARYHGVEVGAFSYGPCLEPGAFPGGVSVGRYVSIAAGVEAIRRNHPLDHLSMHPFFFNPVLGLVGESLVEDIPLRIEHDAWIGHGAILTSSCARVGIGAVIGAGSVVTRDVPDFAVVAGAPARPIRDRFDDLLKEAILGSRWWERTPAELKRAGMTGRAIDHETLRRFSDAPSTPRPAESLP